MKRYTLDANGKQDVCVIVDVSQMTLLSDISRLDLHMTHAMEALVLASSVSAIPNHDGYFSIHIYRAHSIVGVNVLTNSATRLLSVADRVGLVSTDENVILGINDLAIDYSRKPTEYHNSKPIHVVYGTSKDIDSGGSVMTLLNFKSLNYSVACFRFPSYNGTYPLMRVLSCLDDIPGLEYTITNRLSLLELIKFRVG